MSDPTLSPAVDTTYTDYLAKARERDRLEAECLPANKTALFDALSLAGITQVIVAFDGCGNSGQIESIDAIVGNDPVAIPPLTMTFVEPVWPGPGIDQSEVSVRGALEHLAYRLLYSVVPGWENNDGAFGDFTFDVAERTINLDHNERMTTSYSACFDW